MKHMKIKLSFFSPLLLLMLAGNGCIAFAEEPKKAEELDPVIYERLEFKKNTDYLHDQKKTEMKNTIPVKQFDIYFDGRNKLPNRGDTSFLFQTAERGEKSTVLAKSSDLKLFSDKDVATNVPISKIDEETSNSNGRALIFIVLIGMGLLAVFVIFLPRLVSTSESTQPAK